jgi:membrane protease subunit (stomatin/prohibitin family)
MAAKQDVFSKMLAEAVAPALKEFGLELRTFYVQSVSLPEELQQHLDKASSMRLVGNLQAYTQFQTADSIAIAAANPNGGAGAGVGIGAGIGMGQVMAQALQNPAVSAATTQAEDPLQQLEKLGDLFKKGVLTQAEFDAKKSELLGKI